MSSLTPKQKEAAVDFLTSNCVVTAGAGSGKTRVLSQRYVNLLAYHRDQPNILEQIVAITFTEKAATEMKERIRQEIKLHLEHALQSQSGEEKRWRQLLMEWDCVRISTFHSFCQQLIQDHPLEAGVDPLFSVLDEWEARLLLKEAIHESYPVFWKRYSQNQAAVSWMVGQRLEAIEHALIYVLGQMHSLGWTTDDVYEVTKKRLDQYKADLEKRWQTDFPVWEVELVKRAEKIMEAKPTKTMLNFTETWPLWYPEWKPSESLEEKARLIAVLRECLKGNWGKNRQLREEMLEVCQEIEELLRESRYIEEEQQLSLALCEWIRQVNHRYQQKKEERNALDFDDLQWKACVLLERHPELRYQLQQKIRHVLVDEYQDTNHVQKKLLDLLIKDEHGNIPQGKLFVVGDPKQSIYRFRGADVSLFSKTKEEIKKNQGKEVVLDTNFRSDPELIAFFNHVFVKLMNQDETSPNHYEEVRAREEQSQAEVVVEWIAVPDEVPEGWSERELEARMIAQHILQLRQNGIKENKIAILLRKMTHVKTYEQALASYQIPFHVVKGRGFYDRQEVLDVIHFLKILVQPGNRLAWVGVLRSPFCGVSDETILRIAMEQEWKGEIQDWIKQVDLLEEERRKLEHLANLLKQADHWLGRMKVSDLLERLLDESHYREVLWATPFGKQAVANLQKLVQQARDLKGLPAISVSAYLDWMEEWMQSEQEETEALIESEDSQSVKIMTIHQAKGLEFPVVYLPGLSDQGKPNDTIIYVDREEGLVTQLRDEEGEKVVTKRWQWMKEKEKRLEWEEAVRLFYVAVTRAEERLIFCGKADQLKESIEKTDQWSKWLDGILGYHQVNVEQGCWNYSEGRLPIRVHHSFSDCPDQKDHQARSPLIETYMEGKLTANSSYDEDLFRPIGFREHDQIAISVTKWKQLIQCPRKYYYQHAIGLPELTIEDQEKSQMLETKRLPATLKGTMVHQLLEWLMEPSSQMSDLSSLLHRAWSQFQIAPDEQQVVEKEIRPYLERFLQSTIYQQKNHWQTIWCEWDFTEEMAGIQVSGQIDLLCQNDQGIWYLYDYKTDLISKEHVKQAAYEYEPQLQLYVLALQKRYGWVPQQATLYFLEPDVFYTFSVTDAWLKQAENRLEATAGLLRSTNVHDWYAQPGTGCKHCMYQFLCSEFVESSGVVNK